MKTKLECLERIVKEYVDEHPDYDLIKNYMHLLLDEERMKDFICNCDKYNLVDIELDSTLRVLGYYFFYCIGFDEGFDDGTHHLSW